MSLEAQGQNHMAFMQELAGMTQEETEQSQPPENLDGGNQEQTSTDEGETSGIETTDQSTTAEPTDEEAKGEEQEGATNDWSEDERKMLDAKGWGDLAYGAETSKVIKSLRDLDSQYQRVSQSNSNALNRNAVVENALRNKDIGALKKLGFDLGVDQRTPDDIIKEHDATWNTITEALNPALQQLTNLPDEQYQALYSALSGLQNKFAMNVQKVEAQKKEAEMEARILAKAGINQNTDRGYKALQAKAEANLVDLAASDPRALENYKTIAAETKEGGALFGLNLDLATIYSNPESAKFFNKMADAMDVKNNFEKHFDAETKRRAEQSKKAAGTKPRGGSGGNSAPTLAPLEQAFRGYGSL